MLYAAKQTKKKHGLPLRPPLSAPLMEDTSDFNQATVSVHFAVPPTSELPPDIFFPTDSCQNMDEKCDLKTVS